MPMKGIETIERKDNRADGDYPSAPISFTGSAVGEVGTANRTGCACFANGTAKKIEVW